MGESHLSDTLLFTWEGGVERAVSYLIEVKPTVVWLIEKTKAGYQSNTYLELLSLNLYFYYFFFFLMKS